MGRGWGGDAEIARNGRLLLTLNKDSSKGKGKRKRKCKRKCLQTWRKSLPTFTAQRRRGEGGAPGVFLEEG
jgi:hypothetical protein